MDAQSPTRQRGLGKILARNREELTDGNNQTRAGLRRCQARAMSGTIVRMSFTELTEAFFMKSAGWEAVKNARSLLAAGKVISSNWTPPLLKGVVQEGAASYRAGLVIKGPVDIDNLCTCRASREAGMICAHSVAVGLHHLLNTTSALRTSDTATPVPARPGGRAIAREPA